MSKYLIIKNPDTMHIYKSSWCVATYKRCYFDYTGSGSECILSLIFGRPRLTLVGYLCTDLVPCFLALCISTTKGFEIAHVYFTYYHLPPHVTGYFSSSNNIRDAESRKCELLNTIFGRRTFSYMKCRLSIPLHSYVG
jgi:hypothetical protein